MKAVLTREHKETDNRTRTQLIAQRKADLVKDLSESFSPKRAYVPIVTFKPHRSFLVESPFKDHDPPINTRVITRNKPDLADKVSQIAAPVVTPRSHKHGRKNNSYIISSISLKDTKLESLDERSPLYSSFSDDHVFNLSTNKGLKRLYDSNSPERFWRTEP
eukprot:NODE_8754_length_649_cov_25.965779_g8129_i0.p1 GENE.NODE_8754_length_649_cov_25.965779_g8129_i0~~NODE_8754_length_649_cov_25.965779_g8129_i0.p1  ORF type:complete len:162 (+),score=17.86 NODE_8754_length_649_cov_25.965779_g8129_i0:84-569(+)